MANYLEASKDPAAVEMESIALANLALAKFQVNDVDGSLRVARTILRRDPEGVARRRSRAGHGGAVGVGRETDAEAEWQALCRSGRGSARRCPRRTRGTGAGGIEGDVAAGITGAAGAFISIFATNQYGRLD